MNLIEDEEIEQIMQDSDGTSRPLFWHASLVGSTFPPLNLNLRHVLWPRADGRLYTLLQTGGVALARAVRRVGCSLVRSLYSRIRTGVLTGCGSQLCPDYRER